MLEGLGKNWRRYCFLCRVLDASYGFRNEGWLRSRGSALAKAGTKFFFRFLSMELGRVCIIVTSLCQTDENQFDIGFNAALYVK